MRRRHADAILTRESERLSIGCRLESPIVPFPVAAEAPFPVGVQAPRRGRDEPSPPASVWTAAHVPRSPVRGTPSAASTFDT